jgi:hypothetical protein
MANTTWSGTDKTAGITLSGTNNLTLTTSGGGGQNVRSIDKQNTGKFYCEATCTTATNINFGFANGLCTLTNNLGSAAGSVNSAVVFSTGNIFINGVQTAPTVGSIANGAIVCAAIDLAAGLVWFRNGAAGNWNGNASNNPTTGVGGLAVGPLGNGFAVYAVGGSASAAGSSLTANFGDTSFAGAVPAGFTSGFTSGVLPPLNEVMTQCGVEMWASVAQAARAGPRQSLIM